MSSLTLNPKRLGLLLRGDLAAARTPAIMLAAASGATLVLYVLTSIGGGSPVFHQIAFPIVLVLLGYILSSFTFTEIHETRTGAFLLTSPGSLLEKYVAKILLTAVGWTVAVTVAFTVVTAAGAGLSQLLFRSSHGIFLPVDRWVWEAIAGYLVSQSIFVLGSIYFKKAAFLKTILAGTVIAIAFTLFFMVSWRVVFWGEFARILPTEAEINAVIDVTTPGVTRLVEVMERMGDIAKWTVVPIFAWIVGYARLRETEV